jgi:cytochrome P450
MKEPRMNEPSDPLAAATHPDPYPYYARLVAEQPLHRDVRLQTWVACSASAVTQVLISELCHVRPAHEPVPRVLGESAAAIFQRLVRMNEGAAHARYKQAIVATIAALPRETLVAAARQRADALTRELQPQQNRAALTRFLRVLPVQTMARLLGVAESQIGEVGEWVAGFVGGIGPLASSADIEQGARAAAELLVLFQDMLVAERTCSRGSLFSALAANVGPDVDDVIVANGIGLMSQSYEATAGLIGNTLLALARRPALRAAVSAQPALLGAVIQRVLRADPPTQSTRRWVVRAGNVAGQQMQVGDAILVMLAAAGRDPSVNPSPDDFAITDAGPSNFGAGIHLCPATHQAVLIAETAVAHLLSLEIELEGLTCCCRYRRSNHLRVPVFGGQ